MVIDCDTCAVRDLACGDCVISVLLGHPGLPAPATATTGLPARSAVEIGAEEQRAMEVLAEAGMVPRLRLVPQDPPPAPDRRAG
ncbi:hypothetical protein [Rhodococcus sp. X156]|uniref:hypothetical protein n=1 Tax=Rhodococcus sp. X156 TaxID=2499145 RepID=UPI000FDA2016|nr:hypothetical protein [Rhodococcus sp. X156]